MKTEAETRKKLSAHDFVENGVHFEQLLLREVLVKTVNNADCKQYACAGSERARDVREPREQADDNASQNRDNRNVTFENFFRNARILTETGNLQPGCMNRCA